MRRLRGLARSPKATVTYEGRSQCRKSIRCALKLVVLTHLLCCRGSNDAAGVHCTSWCRIDLAPVKAVCCLGSGQADDKDPCANLAAGLERHEGRGAAALGAAAGELDLEWGSDARDGIHGRALDFCAG